MERTNKQLNELSLTPDMGDADQTYTLPSGEMDKEGAMAKADLYKLATYSYKLFTKIQDEDQFESWVQAKITKAADYIASVYHYLEYERKFTEYGHKLDDSDVLSESQKQELKNKLMEAKSLIKALKITEAKKISKSPKADKDYDGDGKIESGKDEYLGSKDKAIKKAKSKSEKVEEAAPSAGLSKKKKSEVVKKAKAGKDIGKKGKGFKEVEKAAKKSGAKDPKAVAAAAMWKNVKREDIEEAAAQKPSAGLSPETKRNIITKARKGEQIGKNRIPFYDIEKKVAGKVKDPKAVAAAVMWKNIKRETIEQESDETQLDELGNPFKKQSPFSKKGYEKLASRKSDVMHGAEKEFDTADEMDDIEGMSTANQKWKAAQKVKAKATSKASLAKKESADDREFSAKNVGKAAGNIWQGMKNTAAAVGDTIDATKSAVSDFSQGFDAAQAPQKPVTAAKPAAVQKKAVVKESVEIDIIKTLSGIK